MEIKKIKRVIYISRNKLDAKVYSLNLVLTKKDVQSVLENLSSIGINITYSDSENLWKLIFRNDW